MCQGSLLRLHNVTIYVHVKMALCPFSPTSLSSLTSTITHLSPSTSHPLLIIHLSLTSLSSLTIHHHPPLIIHLSPTSLSSLNLHHHPPPIIYLSPTSHHPPLICLSSSTSTHLSLSTSYLSYKVIHKLVPL